MQGDLISRSALKKVLSEKYSGLSDARDEEQFALYSAYKQIVRVIENQPTAYDVEKVVEELEEENQRLKKLRNDCIALSDHEVCDIENKAYNFAIKCVRNGWKE